MLILRGDVCDIIEASGNSIADNFKLSEVWERQYLVTSIIQKVDSKKRKVE